MKHVVYFLRNIRQVGAVAPSSRFLSRRISAPLAEWASGPGNPPLRVLEVGPGTGAITKYIRPVLRTQDHMDVVELNQGLHQYVSDRYASPQIRFHHMNLLDFEPEAPYDFIFSGLPYEAMPKEVVQALWQKKLGLSRIGTVITYFKYINLVNFRSPYERQVVDQCCEKISYEFRNVPPARFFRLRVNESVIGDR